MDKLPQKWPKRVRFSKTIPIEDIKDAWAEKSRVLYLNYLVKGWVLVTEKNKEKGHSGQQLLITKTIPERELQKIWSSDKRVSTLVHGRTDGRTKSWVLISENKEDGHVSQMLYYNDSHSVTLPLAQLKYAIQSAKADHNKRVHSLCYCSNEKIWGAIFEDCPPKTDQSVEDQKMILTTTFPSSRFPSKTRRYKE
eukprot:TRINITY_DN1655_c0_g1_i10.p1 TRINITY_DN1655_c0_g1~~TRINITY_DN1655_c0_g1_i10.p1  ORF type:complete len:195 (+),score=15.37 TRINITY_DN1655_c0_g1_i10:136-720(+)